MKKSRSMLFKYQRVSQLREPRRIGIDTNVLIELIDNTYRSSYYSEPILRHGGFVHRISLERKNTEAVKYFVEKRGLSLDDAWNRINDFCKKNNIKIVERDYDNKELLNSLLTTCKDESIPMHPPDCFIVADFKKAGINTLYSTDETMKKAARLLDMDTPNIPTVHKTIERDIRKLFKRK